MKKYLFIIAILTVSVGIISGRFANAGDSARTPILRHCTDGISRFGKISCGETKAGEPALHAYFYGATSFGEVAKTYPARFEKLMASCRKKSETRAPALQSAASDEPAPVRFLVETVEVCNGKRGYQEPCVRNEDCLENVCHSVRGTCSTVFTPPNPFGP
jgi:hypothetical protein